MTPKTGQMMPWEVPANAQAPPTLATGKMYGSGFVGGASMTQVEHPVINAQRSGITGNIGGGRLNPYGGGALQQTAIPLRYQPTTLIQGQVFQEGLMEPRMGGTVVTADQMSVGGPGPGALSGPPSSWAGGPGMNQGPLSGPPSSWARGSSGFVRNRNADPVLSENFGGSFY
jgi:hypothetical protein